MIKKVTIKTKKIFISKEFAKFLLVGGTAALVNFFSRFCFQIFFSYVFSIACAFILGSIISFILNKNFTFKAHDEKTRIQMFKFTIIAIGSIFLASFLAGIIMFFYNFFTIAYVSQPTMETLTHIFTIGVNTIYNFLAMKYFSFKPIKLNIGKNEFKS